jgi:uncharacterized protein (TIGR02246 family)
MSEPSFNAALHEHLSALQARDIERFAATLGADVTVVDGTGRVMEGRAAVVKSHAEWFGSRDSWTFDYRLRSAREFGGAGLALIDVTYRQSPAGAPVLFLLSLLFERTDDGSWRFVYDQNTPLPVLTG